MANRVRLTPAKKKKFLAALAVNGNVSDAAKQANVSRIAFYALRKKSKQFAEQWEEALEQGIDALELEAHRRAVEGIDEPVYYKGDVVGKVRKYSDTLLIFLLKGNRPEKYADFHKISNPDGKPLTVEIVKFGESKASK